MNNIINSDIFVLVMKLSMVGWLVVLCVLYYPFCVKCPVCKHSMPPWEKAGGEYVYFLGKCRCGASLKETKITKEKYFRIHKILIITAFIFSMILLMGIIISIVSIYFNPSWCPFK